MKSNWPVQGFVIMVVVVAAALLFHDQSPSADGVRISVPSLGEAPQSSDAQVMAGWRIFNGKGCVYCHGPAGRGGVVNPNAQGGKIPPVNKVGESYTDQELREKILYGVAQPEPAVASGPPVMLPMPSWEGNLTPEELDSLVAYLKSLSPKTTGSGDWE